jgi:hypothetical protein
MLDLLPDGKVRERQWRLRFCGLEIDNFDD